MPFFNRVISAAGKNSRGFLIFNLLLLAAICVWYFKNNQPVNLVEPQLATGKLQCVSYAPYYQKGRSPFVPLTLISREQIDKDLALLAQRFACVRTYSVGQGLDYVPEAAAKHGLKVLLGAWIGWGKADNDMELQLAIKRANQYQGTVIGLVVGNEVLLRREQTETAMKAYIERAQQSTEVPVTYADVWEYWIKYRDLEQSVDFVTVHILPYWEDNPRSIEDADMHVSHVMNKVSRNFSKPIFIGETGWPSIGRQRGASVPTLVNQARFLREFVEMAHEKKWNYNLIEAMDQPWKRLLEGTVGGYWGLYSSELEPKFEFHGPVAERQDGWAPLLGALGGAILFGLLAMRAGEQQRNTVFGMVALGAAAGALIPLQLNYLMTASRDLIEWAALSGILAIGWLVLASVPFIAGKQDTAVPAKRLLQACLVILVASAAVAGYLLAVDGRYRNFPIVLYWLPLVQLALGLRLLGTALKPVWQRALYGLNAFAVGMAIVCILLEPNNLQALIWTGLTALLAYAAGIRTNTEFDMKKTA